MNHSRPLRCAEFGVVAALCGALGCVMQSNGSPHGGSGAVGGVESAPLPLRRLDVPVLPVAEVFAKELAKHPDLTRAGLFGELGLGEEGDQPLSFDPTKVRYFSAIADKLKLTDEERTLYRQNGMVGVDHEQRYSMGSAYYAIYTRDLPVFVTSDSVLHALHRSYDGILKELEITVMLPLITEVLAGAHAELERRRGELRGGALATSAEDVDIYLTVARSLLGGAGAAPDANAPPDESGILVAPPPVKLAASKLGKQTEVDRLLALITSLTIQVPPDDEGTRLRGGKRYIDYSQFRPRGHYTESELLRRYFRALMWLGRADIGFVLSPPNGGRTLRPRVERERRGAALLTWLLKSSGGDRRLLAMSEVLDFFVGRSDSLTVAQVARALDLANVDLPGELESAATLERVHKELVASTPSKKIRSQVLMSQRMDPERVRPPQVFQLFGQRFILDSFVLANVVYDTILFNNKKVERTMPAGIDVMAALGNDEAVRLLAPELDQHKYASNLLALRRTVEAHTPDHWIQNLYNIWLDALRTLDAAPPGGAAFPEVMRRTPWHRKQLQTQLGSWAELRHDTILYSEQSYTAGIECEYPEGLVEPYPELYLRLRLFATEGARLLEGFRPELALAEAADWASRVRERQAQFLRNFAAIMQRLEGMARKQLAARPFTSAERSFLKRTIDARGGGSGPPTYSGWYPDLIYGDGPADWEPTVADVHTDPNSKQALEVAVGDVNFLVVAIDNRGDRAAYVGPIYSYYEFPQPVSKRLTDQEWRAWIRQGKLPKRPDWTRAFQAPPKPRAL